MSVDQGREPAVRVSGRELNKAFHEFKESDSERAPNYLLLPTGTRANRMLVAGTLTDITEHGDGDMVTATVVDPSSNNTDDRTEIRLSAGQYSPEAKRTLEQIEVPQYVIVVGKPDVYAGDDKDVAESLEDLVSVSISPESVTVVDENSRDHAVTEITKQTQSRINNIRSGDAPYAELVQSMYQSNELSEVIETITGGVIEMVRDQSQTAYDEFESEHGEASPRPFTVEADTASESDTEPAEAGTESDTASETDGDESAEDSEQWEDGISDSDSDESEKSPEERGADLATGP